MYGCARSGHRPPAAFFASLRRWWTHWLVPQYVYLSFGDNPLLLELKDEAQADQLGAEIRRLAEDPQLLFQEALPAPELSFGSRCG